MRISRTVTARALVATALAGSAIPAVALAAGSSPGSQTGSGEGAYTTQGAWAFRSAPKLHPPKVRVSSGTVARYRQLVPGYFLIANFPNITAGKPLSGQGGPLILDNRLAPVWFHPTSTDVTAGDLKQQTLDGKPVLSWWEGVVSNTGATVSGAVYVVDSHYRRVAKLTGDSKDGWTISIHDAVIRGHDAWVTAYRYIPHQDLSAYGGSQSGTLYDSAVQEYNLRTGKLLYTWDAYQHIPLSQSGHAPPNPQVPWDAYHENSIQLVGHGQFLVSMRATGAGYLVDMATGRVVWTLGGNASTFQIPDAARFYFQHNMLLLPHGVVTVFDDHCCAIVGPGKFAPPPGNQPSRGLVLKLDFVHKSVSLVHQYQHNPALNVAFTGSMQQLPNGGALVGWGNAPFFTEFSASGQRLLDAILPGVDITYRALYTPQWVGTPFYPPQAAVQRKRSRVTVYASWNGATQVAGWEVLAGSDARRLAYAAVEPKRGFETSISLGRVAYRVYRVAALDAHGKVLRRSHILRLGSGNGQVVG